MDSRTKKTMERAKKLRAMSYVVRCIAVSVQARAFSLRRNAEAVAKGVRSRRTG